MPPKPITKKTIAQMAEIVRQNKEIEERHLALQRPSGKITVPTGNALDYESLFNQIIAVMDELHERIKLLEDAP